MLEGAKEAAVCPALASTWPTPLVLWGGEPSADHEVGSGLGDVCGALSG